MQVPATLALGWRPSLTPSHQPHEGILAQGVPTKCQWRVKPDRGRIKKVSSPQLIFTTAHRYWNLFFQTYFDILQAKPRPTSSPRLKLTGGIVSDEVLLRPIEVDCRALHSQKATAEKHSSIAQASICIHPKSPHRTI